MFYTEHAAYTQDELKQLILSGIGEANLVVVIGSSPSALSSLLQLSELETSVRIYEVDRMVDCSGNLLDVHVPYAWERLTKRSCPPPLLFANIDLAAQEVAMEIATILLSAPDPYEPRLMMFSRDGRQAAYAMLDVTEHDDEAVLIEVMF